MMHYFLALQFLKDNKFWATLLLLVFCIQLVFIEGAGISSLKVTIMAICPLIFLFKVPFLSPAFRWGILYFISCLLISLLHGQMRFSTIGYLGLFIGMYITYYNLIYSKSFTLTYFIKLVQVLIISFGVCLLLQQISILIGIRNFPFINLVNQNFLAIDKLPSLTIEPSHSARILTALMLAYIKCNEIKNDTPFKISHFFTKENKWTTLCFFWPMFTMGSGTAFMGLGILSIYFITKRNFLYIIPIFLLMLTIGEIIGIKQMQRATNLLEATILTGDVETMHKTEGSGAIRIIPVINTFTDVDLFDQETWLGKGTQSKEYAKDFWKRTTDKIIIVEQYGLLTFIISLLLVFKCAIYRFFSIETLIFIGLLGLSIANVYYSWSIMMVFTTIKYFAIQNRTNDIAYQ